MKAAVRSVCTRVNSASNCAMDQQAQLAIGSG